MSRERLPTKDSFRQADINIKILICLMGKNNLNKIREEIMNLVTKDVIYRSWEENIGKELDSMVKDVDEKNIRGIELCVSGMVLRNVQAKGTSYVEVDKKLNGHMLSGKKRGPKPKFKVKNKPYWEKGLVGVGYVIRGDGGLYKITKRGCYRVVTYCFDEKREYPKVESKISWKDNEF